MRLKSSKNIGAALIKWIDVEFEEEMKRDVMNGHDEP